MREGHDSRQICNGQRDVAPSINQLGPLKDGESKRCSGTNLLVLNCAATVRERGNAILEATLQAMCSEATNTMQEHIAKIRDQAEREVDEAQQEQREAESALTELEEENATLVLALQEAQAQIAALHGCGTVP
jgi:oligoendopeptidase F